MLATNGILVAYRWAVAALIAIASSSGFATSGALEIATDTTLHEDHIGPITFVADSVTLNCSGHQVSAPGAFQTILVQQRVGVTVKNCRITGGVYGLYVIASTDVTIKNNVTFGNEGTGMFLTNSDGLTIKNNLSTNNGVAGIDAQFLMHSTVHHNAATRNGIFGFLFLVDNDNEFTHNFAADNTAFGFILFSSSGNLVKKNAACGHEVDLVLDTIQPGANGFKNNSFCIVDEQSS
jgi:parallel beta-helix repeat protein